MYMNLKHNKQKRISLNTTTIHGIIGVHWPPPPNLIFCSGPTQLFWSEIFRFHPKNRGGCYHVSFIAYFTKLIYSKSLYFIKSLIITKLRSSKLLYQLYTDYYTKNRDEHSVQKSESLQQNEKSYEKRRYSLLVQLTDCPLQ